MGTRGFSLDAAVKWIHTGCDMVTCDFDIYVSCLCHLHPPLHRGLTADASCTFKCRHIPRQYCPFTNHVSWCFALGPYANSTDRPPVTNGHRAACARLQPVFPSAVPPSTPPPPPLPPLPPPPPLSPIPYPAPDTPLGNSMLLSAVLSSLSAEGYVNRYRNSWTAAVAATKTFVEDMSRKRGRPPAGGRVSIPMADLPVPVPLSKFQWPSVSPFLSSPGFCTLICLVHIDKSGPFIWECLVEYLASIQIPVALSESRCPASSSSHWSGLFL